MFIKYASAGVLQVVDYRSVESMFRQNKKTVSTISPDSLYFSCHGIRGNFPPNDNGDLFPWKELIGKHHSGKYVWETWQGKNLLENHEPRNLRGSIVDTYPLHEIRSIDMLCAVDRVQYPDLAKKIASGTVTDTSMGLICQKGVCSICGNEATNEQEWCEHMKFEKGKKIDGHLVYELNYGLEGLENSIITVGRGAEGISKIREILSHKTNLSGEQVDRLIFAEYSKFCKGLNVSEEEFLVYMIDKLGLK